MSPSLLFQVGLVAAVSVAGTYYLSGNMAEAEAERTAQAEADKSAPKTASRVAATPTLSKGSVVSIPRTQGQFFVQGRANQGHIRFLVDTGASTVALTAPDARKAGIDLNALRYDVLVDTANGRTKAARVVLDELRIGGVRVADVEALVMSDGLHISLLGMTYLGRLQKVEVLPNQMILRR
ncbi:MAG: TIGR02281 family clan AA aspartic protease [Pseudomonadota bacterium]